MSFGIAFYDDEIKTTLIIASEGEFHTEFTPNTFSKSGDYRVEDNSLEVFKFETDKLEGILRCISVKQADLDTLETEFNLRRVFYFFPDLVNDPTTSYAVRWVNKGFSAVYDQLIDLFSININLKEV